MNRGVDPWWDPSTLWTYKLDPGWVRPLVNRVDLWWDPSTLWTYKFDPGWVRPLCGLISLTLVGSVHFVNRVDP